MINTLIVDAQRMIRELLEIYIRSDSRYNLAASISNASAAPEICRKNRIDLVLMDVLTENNESGLEAARMIRSESAETKIIVVTSVVDDEVLEKARIVGVDSLWYKNVSQVHLMDVVERTLNGESIFPESIPSVMVGYTSSNEFTRKEKEVLHWLLRGFSYPQIAERMGVELPTIKYHVGNMLQKTGFRDKLQLALAVQSTRCIVNDI